MDTLLAHQIWATDRIGQLPLPPTRGREGLAPARRQAALVVVTGEATHG